MAVIKYHKLVRDRIPEIIEAQGKTCLCETLDAEEYLRMLDEKLSEELAEYQSRYTVSNVTQLDGQLLLQLVGDDVPPSRTDRTRVSLDDVYLYYIHADKAKTEK